MICTLGILFCIQTTDVPALPMMLFVNCGDLLNGEVKTKDYQKAAIEGIKAADCPLGRTISVSKKPGDKNPDAKWFSTTELLDSAGISYKDNGDSHIVKFSP